MKRSLRWAVVGAALGVAVAVVAWAPAAWLAGWLAGASGERLLLADPRGSVWSGSAVPVLTGGPGSHDASALPGRLSWSIGLDGLALSLRARHACCINGELQLRLQPGVGRLTVTLPPSTGAIGQWPASWLAGLGTPFNTLQPGGWLSLSSSGLVGRSEQGHWSFDGNAALTLGALSSRISPLDTLGSYRLALTGGPAQSTLQLVTLAGPLQLSGSGDWSGRGFRFRGQARAEPGFEGALNNLLNIIGRRQGALSVLSIG